MKYTQHKVVLFIEDVMKERIIQNILRNSKRNKDYLLTGLSKRDYHNIHLITVHPLLNLLSDLEYDLIDEKTLSTKEKQRLISLRKDDKFIKLDNFDKNKILKEEKERILCRYIDNLSQKQKRNMLKNLNKKNNPVIEYVNNKEAMMGRMIQVKFPKITSKQALLILKYWGNCFNHTRLVNRMDETREFVKRKTKIKIVSKDGIQIVPIYIHIQSSEANLCSYLECEWYELVSERFRRKAKKEHDKRVAAWKDVPQPLIKMFKVEEIFDDEPFILMKLMRITDCYSKIVPYVKHEFKTIQNKINGYYYEKLKESGILKSIKH